MPIAVPQATWKWNVFGRPYRSQIAIARAAGCDSLVVAPGNWRQAQAEGLTAAEMRRMAADAGIALSFLDGLTCWSPVRFPPEPSSFVHEAFRAEFDFSPEAAFDMCGELGLSSILAAAGFEQPTAMPMSEQIDHFGRFCEAAARHGLAVELEFMPMMGVPGMREALEIVAGAGAANAGVLVDTKHFMRSGGDLDLLARVPRGLIRHVQVADALPREVGQSAWEDAVTRRVMPGEGVLPLAEIMAVLLATQHLASVGLEVSSPAIHALGEAAAGEALRAGLARVMDDACALAAA